VQIIAATALILIVLIAAVLTRRPAMKPGSDGHAGAIHHQVTFTGREQTPTLSPDGERIAYVTNDSPDRRIVVQEIGGSAPRVLVSVPEAGSLRWSPDGSEMLFWARGRGLDGVYMISLAGGAPRRVGPTATGGACWSPDGSTIAWVSFLTHEVRFVDKAGETRRSAKLQDTRGWIWDLDWSAASDRLLFVANDAAGRPSVWTMRPDGVDQTRVLTSPSEILAARWAPSGDAFYYFSRVNQTVSLFKASIDQGSADAPILLLSGLETDHSFGLSSDGRKLVYARAPYYSNLWIASQDSEVQLTHGTSIVERPRVSPDGTTILFTMGYESRANLFTIPAEGGVPKQLTYLNAFSLGGAWSPDGREIAFASNEGGRSRIWLVNANGSSPRAVVGAAMSDTYDISWAPGRRLLYQTEGNRNFKLVDAATLAEEALVEDDSVGWIASPVYAPDGSRIAVAWNRTPGRGIWTIDQGDRRPTVLRAVDRRTEPWPILIGWAPDGSSVLGFDGTRAAYRGPLAPYGETTTAARIVSVPLDGGPMLTVRPLPFEEIGSVAPFPDGRRFVVTVYSSRSDIWVVDDFDRRRQ
jgi:Tol biopolymer transport system component